jgi:transposase
MNATDWHEIRRLHDEGLGVRAIAARLRMHRRKVRAALAAQRPPTRKGRTRGSLIDPYRGWLLAKLQLYPELSAARLHAMLREQGFAGGYTLVKQTVAQLRPRLKRVYQELHFAPGDCAQVDWGVWQAADLAGGGRRRLSFFTMVLCHSRMLYAELCYGESLEFWLAAHRHAFEAFGGVPARVMVDNCKTAVLRPRRGDRDADLNADYAAFAGHYGFAVVPCTPRRPNEKGRVERAVGYVKSGFLAGRQPASPEALNPALRQWLATTANVRVHRLTGDRPVDRFAQAEQAALRPLPAVPHPGAAIAGAVATSCCRVTVDTNRYSVPPGFASQRLVLHRYPDRIVLFTPGGQFVADHVRSFARHADLVDPEHAGSLKRLTRDARDNRQLSAFLALGSAAEAYLRHLQEKRIDYLGHVRRINAQADSFGRDAVARALADALDQQAYASDYIHNLLHMRQRLDRQAPSPLHIVRHADLLELTLDQPNLDAYDRQETP